jgi:regulator of sigma E protease
LAIPNDADNIRPVEPAPDSPEAEQAAAAPTGWLRRNGPLLLLIVAFFLFLHFYVGVTVDGFRTGIIAALGLGFVIFIHELGHFAVAKWCDVHVETFSIGFGPPLPGCAFRWGETLYKIALFPLGGYVKMVGEGAESDESDTDPRSFKNKPVWQRMAIISAGVTMNLILAFFCFVFVFFTHGDEQAPGVIGMIADGSPVWKTPARTGDVIHQIGAQDNRPPFEVLQKEVMNSTQGEALDFVFGPPNGTPSQLVHTKIVPRKEAGDLKPMIGLNPPYQLRLLPKRAAREHSIPAIYGSAASRAEPAFEFDDQIVGTTDPDHPDQVKELPPDPRNPKHRDYFEYNRRLVRLAGKPITIQVERGDGEKVNIQVPPAYHYTLGLRMRMGQITAVRENSPAAKASVQPGDIIEKVEVGSGKERKALQAALDPERLPFDLEQWAAGEKAPRSVTMTVVRKNPPPNHNERQRLDLTMTWDDSWNDNIELPLSNRAPLSVSGLGLAYLVETTVEDVRPDSPAAKAGVQKGDVIKEIQYYTAGKTPDATAKAEKWQALNSEQWASVTFLLQRANAKHVGLRLARPAPVAGAKPESADNAEKADKTQVDVDLIAQEDTTWPVSDRGLLFLMDEQIVKAHSLGQALVMGMDKSWFFIDMLFGNLRGLVTGRLSSENFGGPITIARFAYISAADSIYKFLIFLGIIGVNLAVVNFLPIPVLDGGHMVFLIYEKLRGKPAPERVRVAASLVGLTLILGLMGFVLYLDVSKL